MAKKKAKKKSVKKASKRKAAPKKKAATKKTVKGAKGSLESRLDRLEKLLVRVLESQDAASESVSETEAVGEVEFLSRIPLFSRMMKKEVAAVALLSEDVRVPATEMLFAEGDNGDSMYVVVTGALEIFRQDVLGDRQIAVIWPGGVIGEMALIEGKPRSANVRAHEDSRLLVISKNSFERLKAENPAVATKFMDELLQLVSSRLRDTTEQLMMAKQVADRQKATGQGL